MSEIISYGWLTDFNDKKFAPKSLFDYIYASTTDGRTLTQYFSDFTTELNNRDLQVNLASDNSVKFSSPGAIGVTGILDVPNGGTGQSSFAANSILLGNGSSQLKSLASTAGFFVSAKNGDAPQYSAISALWESLNPDTQGPGFYIGFSSGDKRYYMGEVPLAASNQAGAVSTGAQTFEGAKTFNTTAVFKDSAVVNNALSVKNNVVIQSGQLIFGNSNAIGQDHNNKFFITDNNDNAVFYVDDVGVHAINFYIDNEITGHDTSFSETLKWIGDIDNYTKAVNGDLAQEIADRKNSTLYVALGTASKTKKLQDVAIGIDGVLNVANGGTGLDNLTKNSILLGNGTSAVSLIGATQGFLVCNSTSNQPHYAGISALWESTSPTTQGPTLYISFDSSNNKQYKMDEVPLASSNYAGVISTGAQEINGSKTFLSKTYFSSDIDIAAKATIKDDLTITSGNLVFGNGTSILGQSYTDKFFINDNNDKTIFYADATGLHAVEFYIKNNVTGEDTNFSAALGRITALEGRSTNIESDLAQEVADRKNSVLYVALGTASTTKKIQDTAIGVDGVLNVTNGGTGLNSLTKNSILLGNDTSAVSLIGAAQGFLVCNSTSNQPHYAGISALWESTNPTTQGPTLYISFDSNNTKQYKMDEVPLASKNYAGAISTGAQEINGSKTFLSNTQFDGNITVVGTSAFTSKATFSSDIDVTGSAKVNNDLTIQTGNLVFGNNSCILGQSFTDSFFINDANDNTIFYADNNGLHAVEYWIKNANYDTNFSSALGRIRDLESKTAETEADLTQEITDRKNSVLYVALDTTSKTKTLQDSGIGVDGILPIVHGGTGNSLGYILTGLKSGTTSGTCATAEGKNVTASGLYSHGEGLNTSATGNYSHAQGYCSIASGSASHASGARAVASGAASFAHGQNVEARGTNSFAAGIGAFALGNTSMSLGDYSIASGFGAISIGHGISQEIQLVGPANSTEYTLSTVKRVGASKMPGQWSGSSIISPNNVDTTTSYTKQYNVGQTIPQTLKTQQISYTYELILSPGRTYTFHQGSSSCYGFLTKSGTSYSNKTSLSRTLTPTSPIYCLANAGSITYQWVQSGRTPIYEKLTNKIIGYKVTYYRRTTNNAHISPPYATYVEAVSTALPENSYVCGDFGFAKVVSQNDAVITFDKPVFESAKTTNSPGTTGLVTADGGAKGAYSIALGLNNSALNDYSVAIGCYNITKSNYQTVLGCYNLEDEANLLVVGNGSNANSRSNALILDWEGNLTLSGELLANAATASSFNEDAIIELIGHITGTASSTKDWTINTTISDNVITNGMLINSSITIAGTEVNLGESISAETLKSNLDLTDTYLPLSGGTLTGALAGTSATFSGNVTAAKVYGAVWNDYAEYRSQKDFVEPGYCVVSKDNGQVSKTTKKYQVCDGIVSDTFGFAIGETNNCKTPLAVAGRVLAYCEGDKYNYHAGDTVCAGPGGKVVKMTREEIQMWPDRIVGTVSEIPEYETWGSGNIKVNGRIWIKVK